MSCSCSSTCQSSNLSIWTLLTIRNTETSSLVLVSNRISLVRLWHSSKHNTLDKLIENLTTYGPPTPIVRLLLEHSCTVFFWVAYYLAGKTHGQFIKACFKMCMLPCFVFLYVHLYCCSLMLCTHVFVAHVFA